MEGRASLSNGVVFLVSGFTTIKEGEEGSKRGRMRHLLDITKAMLEISRGKAGKQSLIAEPAAPRYLLRDRQRC